MNKKAMVQSQAIMYVLGMIIVASILLFGFKSINSFRKQGQEMQLIKFKDVVMTSVREISSEYNSVEPVSVMGVKGIQKLCFYSSGTVDSAQYPLVADLVESGAEENAFLVSDKGMEDAFNVGVIEVENGFLCIDAINNKYDFTLQGMGASAKIMS